MGIDHRKVGWLGNDYACQLRQICRNPANRFAPQLSVSSPAVAAKIISPFSFAPLWTISHIAVIAAAMPPFISLAPLPNILPSTSRPQMAGISIVPCRSEPHRDARQKAMPVFVAPDFICTTIFARFLSHVSMSHSNPKLRAHSSAMTSAAANSPFSAVERAFISFLSKLHHRRGIISQNTCSCAKIFVADLTFCQHNTGL